MGHGHTADLDERQQIFDQRGQFGHGARDGNFILFAVLFQPAGFLGPRVHQRRAVQLQLIDHGLQESTLLARGFHQHEGNVGPRHFNREARKPRAGAYVDQARRAERDRSGGRQTVEEVFDHDLARIDD